MNWKEQLKNKWFVNDEQGGWTVAQGEVEDFIKSLIKQVIEDIPDVPSYTEYEHWVNKMENIKQQLKAKWLK